MKKLAIVAGGIALLLIIAFFWLAAGASPDHAPKDVKTIELGTP